MGFGLGDVKMLGVKKFLIFFMVFFFFGIFISWVRFCRFKFFWLLVLGFLMLMVEIVFIWFEEWIDGVLVGVIGLIIFILMFGDLLEKIDVCCMVEWRDGVWEGCSGVIIFIVIVFLVKFCRDGVFCVINVFFIFSNIFGVIVFLIVCVFFDFSDGVWELCMGVIIWINFVFFLKFFKEGVFDSFKDFVKFKFCFLGFEVSLFFVVVCGVVMEIDGGVVNILGIFLKFLIVILCFCGVFVVLVRFDN